MLPAVLQDRLAREAVTRITIAAKERQCVMLLRHSIAHPPSHSPEAVVLQHWDNFTKFNLFLTRNSSGFGPECIVCDVLRCFFLVQKIERARCGGVASHLRY